MEETIYKDGNTVSNLELEQINKEKEENKKQE